MLIGNPYKFCFMIERIPEWETSFINGIMFVAVNDDIYPKEMRTTTFNSELLDILDSAFTDPVNDKTLYDMSDAELFRHMAETTYPPDEDTLNDYRFHIPFHEICDSGYAFFVITNGENVRILVGKWEGDSLAFVDSTEISLQEYNDIIAQLRSFYNGGKF